MSGQGSRILYASVFTMTLQSIIFGVGISMPNNSAVAMTWNGVDGPFVGQAPTFNPPLTTGDLAWVASLFGIGGVVGSILGGPLCQNFGPKWAAIYTDMIFIMCGVVMGLAEGSNMLIIGRVLLGVGVGICCNSVPLYINNVAPVTLRGSLGTLHQIGVVTGCFFANVLGMQSVCGNPGLWFVLWSSPAVIAAMHALFMIGLPDDPKFLFDQGQEVLSTRELCRLRPPACNLSAEVAAMKESLTTRKAEGELSLTSQFALLFSPQYFKQISIAVILMLGQQLSGINAITFYSSAIFATAGLENSEVASLTVNVFNLIVILPVVRLIEVKGRRPLTIWGFAGQGLSHLAFVLCLVYGFTWPSVLCVLAGVACFSIGPGPVPWMLAGELIPTRLVSSAVMLVAIVNWIFTFVIGQAYPLMNDALGPYSFAPFAVSCFLVALYAHTTMPETKGKTSEEIDALFGNQAGGVRYIPLAQRYSQ